MIETINEYDFKDAVIEEIQDKTTFIKIDGTEGFIIGAY
jgi:hypothetical protein